MKYQIAPIWFCQDLEKDKVFLTRVNWKSGEQLSSGVTINRRTGWAKILDAIADNSAMTRG